MDSIWLPLATASILGQAPRIRCFKQFTADYSGPRRLSISHKKVINDK